ncbi:MAG: zf-HC2 domain-containing protein [Roseateles asaccharophilus]|uniref:zf-HC2 domain-containing protein n=1 Tax=Roseateles asaccharophilus TaxID=582607 RepID=UPI00391AABEA
MSLFKKNCREVTSLVLQAEDRALSWHERLALRLHMLACRACPRFAQQVQLMRRASERWRRYSDESGG